MRCLRWPYGKTAFTSVDGRANFILFLLTYSFSATFSKFTHIFMWVLQSPKQSSPELKEESPDRPADDLQRTYGRQEA